MFGRSKPVLFERYGSRRSRFSMPRWLILLLCGTAAGAGGVVFLQERYLPPRLSSEASTQLRASYERAESERLRLQGELGATTKRLDTALAESKRLTDGLASSRESADRLRGLASALVTSLPPDPRGGDVEVRAARFTTDGANLAYDVVLTRSRQGAKPMTGVMQLMVTGTSGKGSEITTALKPVAITMDPYASLSGKLALPDGFKPRQTTIQILDRADGRLLGRRVMNIK